MSIQSTVNISRQAAIDRIVTISGLAKGEKYRQIALAGFETDYAVIDLVEDLQVDTSNIENWTDDMLEETMDKPFFRWSMFYNYLIKEEEDVSNS